MDWLEEELGSYDNDYLIIDCPGMIVVLTNYYEIGSSLICALRPD